MIESRRFAMFLVPALVLAAAQLLPEPPASLRVLPDAHAIVGAPLTPVSVAGVARRTTRRTVVVASETAAVAGQANAQAATAQQQAATAQQQSATAQQQSATAQQQSATAQQQAAGAGQALPLGTVVTALPAGCSQVTSGGVEYSKCGANYFRAAFQGNNLVYVTSKP
jgi:hypothetical protein